MLNTCKTTSQAVQLIKQALDSGIAPRFVKIFFFCSQAVDIPTTHSERTCLRLAVMCIKAGRVYTCCIRVYTCCIRVYTYCIRVYLLHTASARASSWLKCTSRKAICRHTQDSSTLLSRASKRCVCLCVYNIRTYIHTCICVCMYICTYAVCMYGCISISKYIHIYICMYIYRYRYVYTHTYIYIYVHIHTYTYTYTYIYISSTTAQNRNHLDILNLRIGLYITQLLYRKLKFFTL